MGMIRLVAIEWDGKDARVALARSRGKSITLEQAFVVELPAREGSAGAGDAEAGAKIAAALTQRGIGKGEALVAVGRANIELRFLSTPPVPAEELPDVVRFQAVRQFSALGEEWPLDFVPLDANSDGGTNVLAAAIAPDLVKQIKRTCTAAGLTAERLVLRPFAAASLLRRTLPDARCRMIVDLLNDEADLTVMIGEQVVFPRTVRLPATTDAEALARVLLGEGRRTIIAAQNQLGGRRVEDVVIVGDSKHHAAVKSFLERELQVEVQLFDPFSAVELSSELRNKLPEFPGTFAPLIGMLLDEGIDQRHAIDFLHPRQRPLPPDRRRQCIIAGTAAAALALVLAIWVTVGLWQQGSEIKQLKQDLQKQTKLAKQGEKPRAQAAKIEEFVAADVTWLNELHRLSQQFPPGEQAIVEDLFATSSPIGGGGKITIQCRADETTTIARAEAALRDANHTVFGSGTSQDPKATRLPWRFKEEIAISTAAEDEPLPGQAAAKSPAAKTPARNVPASKTKARTMKAPAGGAS
jgi:Tfp pilus assembly PilM family ATPase